MLRNILLTIILVLLAYGFWTSADFKEISAGIAIFLFGMMFLENGFKSFNGSTLENILRKSTDKLYKSIGFGIISTTLMQSSTLVSILTISFLSAGLIGLAQGIGIVFGANIGTTGGAWLVAGFGLKINISAYAMPIIVFGLVFILQKQKSLKGIGYILAGLGFLFLGIHYMKDGFEAFKSTIDLAAFGGEGIKYLFIFTAIGIFVTIVMQSSNATLVLIITALSVGQISYENALALAIGANVGTTVTAIISSMNSNIEGKRLAAAHFIFNIVTSIIAILFISQIMYLVDYISSNLGIASDNYTLKLAVFHTIFNVIGVITMIPFINYLVKFLETFVKNSTDIKNDGDIDTTKYLNNSALELPETSYAVIISETKHLYENASNIIMQGLNLKESIVTSATIPIEESINEEFDKTVDIDDLYERKIKGIYGDIIDFSTRAQFDISSEYIKEIYKLKLANMHLVEAVQNTKYLQKNILKYSQNTNIHIKEEYIKIRQNLAKLLRDIDKIYNAKEDDVIVLLISKTKVHLKKYDIISNGILDDLIRKSLITNEMATSLMNDSLYAHNIAEKLVLMAETIFIDRTSDFKKIDDNMSISSDELDEFLEQELNNGTK